MSMSLAMADRPHYVYRHYDADGRVLYIGCTSDPDKRFGQRRTAQSSADWWPLVARTEVTGPMSYAEAVYAEAQAIRADRPPHNKHVPPPLTLQQIRRKLAAWRLFADARAGVLP